MSIPLRPLLYRRLELLTGGDLKVACPLEPFLSHYVNYADRTTFEIDSRGESYRINCPYCNDTRKRLWINHMWGHRDPQTGSQNLWLCKCFNENCLSTFKRQRDLYSLVFGPRGPNREDIVNFVKVDDREPEEVGPPGYVIPLNELPAAHPAISYLASRGWEDLQELIQYYGVGFCCAAPDKFHTAEGRLIAPIYFGGKYVGWQARVIGEPMKNQPKYYTMPGLQKSKILYNFDIASRYPFGVVVEGVTDVWAYGPPAVGLLGKTASTRQRSLIVDMTRSGRWQHVIIMLDGDAVDEMQELCDLLAGVPNLSCIQLPNGNDPADIDRVTLYSYTSKAIPGTTFVPGPGPLLGAGYELAGSTTDNRRP